jgi:hypothetical protein
MELAPEDHGVIAPLEGPLVWVDGDPAEQHHVLIQRPQQDQAVLLTAGFGENRDRVEDAAIRATSAVSAGRPNFSPR